MALIYLIEKEFKQIIRNPFMPKVIIFMSCMMLLVMPWVADFEVKNVNVCVVDNDHSAYSQRMIHKISSSTYFHLVAIAQNDNEAMQSVESGNADVILEIQPDFEKNLICEGEANVMLSVNAVNGVKGGLGNAYLLGILHDYAAELRTEQMPISTQIGLPIMDVVPQNRFNVHLNYKKFMVPALIVMLLTLFGGFLPALSIVNEKERGTIEQINVTPVSKITFILAKLIPYWCIGFFALNFGIALAALIYGFVPMGSIFTIYIFTTIYVLAVSGFGLVISNYSDTVQQGIFLVFFFMIILILMSGLFTSVRSMPEWAQVITIFNPLKYFIQVMRLIYLKGSVFSELITQFLALCVFAIGFNIWAVLSYRKSR